jgi:transposase
MLTNLFFPHIAGVRVERLWRDGATIHLEVVATQRGARCPLCQRRSRRQHSQYTRTLADLPCAGDRVVLHLHVRRFVCRVRWCRRKLFAERLPDLVVPFARRTTRLSVHLLRTAFALGGEGGAAHAAAEGTPVSARTLLRLIRSAPLPPAGAVRVLGVDDWSRRKGHSYGTILVNLETHTVIDLLPDRTAETLAAWLRQHPELEIVSRDRSGAYAEGIRQGAPQAVQVADRFHLHKNVTDVLERYLTRKHTAVRQAAQDGRAVDTPVTDEPPADAAPPLPSREQPERRAHRLARYEEVVALRACGASVRTIATRIGIGQRTVQRWLRAGRFPERRQRSERPGQVAPFAAYLRERWAQGCHNATQLWQELRERGYTGCYGSVAALVATWRGERYRHRGRVKVRQAAAADGCAYTPRQVCWLLLRPLDDLTADEQAYLTRLYHTCPQVALAEALVEEFATVLRERDVDGLYTWLRGAEASGIKELQGVARSLWLDRQAVEAAVRLDWSNGQVEGKVNKLKTTKRAQYGRATFDLLRRRVLHAA